MASQIYEARDEGNYTNKEICELLDINDALLNKILEKRPEYEHKIVHVLKVLYADSNYDKPYKKYK